MGAGFECTNMESLCLLAQIRRAPVESQISNSKATAEHTQKCLVVDSVKSGTEVKQHQSTDITVVDCLNYLVMGGNNGGLSRVICSVGRLATRQEMLRFKVSWPNVLHYLMG